MSVERTTRRVAIGLAAFLLSCATCFSQAPEWTINNGESGSRVVAGQSAVSRAFGLTSIRATGTDSTFTIPMSEEEAFESSARPFFAVRYRATSAQKIGGLFFTNDQNLKSLSDKSFSSFEVTPDGEWHNLVKDMREYSHGNWRGVITSFRLDILNPTSVGDEYSISRLGFFESAEAARDFLANAIDAPDYSFDYASYGPRHKLTVPGGVLNDSTPLEALNLDNPDGASALLRSGVAREAIVVSCAEGDREETTPLCDVNSRGFVVYSVTRAGKWRVCDASERANASDLPDGAPGAAIRFVLARGLMTLDAQGRFLPDAKLSAEDARRVSASLRDAIGEGPLSKAVARVAERFEDAEATVMTRGEGAQILADGIRDALGARIDSPYEPEYFSRERLRIGAWGNFRPQYYSDEFMRTYADCGFDFLLSLSGIGSTELLRAGDRYGVEVYVNDGSYHNPETGADEYFDHPSFGGCFVTDEPGSDQYDKLAQECNAYARATGKTPYVNLLPMYANAAQLKYGAGAAAIEYYDSDPELFRKYCADFCKKFDVDYICTDIYPLNWSDGKKTTYPEYVESINQIASVAREYDREFWCYIQTFAWIASKRTPTEAEYRWQCYSMLSFGCKCILCWTYAGYNQQFPSLVDIDGVQTRAWYDARAVFWELRRLSDEYVKYRNVGAFTVNCSDATPYLKMSGEYKDFQAVEDIQCSEPLLVGCFDKKEGEGAAFTLVNMSELQDERGATVRVKPTSGLRAVSWYRGAPQMLTPDDEGFVSLYLASGDGVFVTLEPCE